MARSGSTDFSITRDDIINRAHELIGRLWPGGTLKTAEITNAALYLNMMVKSWQAYGLHMWKRKDATVFLALNQKTYQLGLTSSDHATLSFVETTTTADHVSTDTVIALTSTTGMTNGDNIGFVLDSGALYWDTIATVDNSTQATLTTGLSGDAESGSEVYTYTTLADRPLRITEARRKSGNNEIELIESSKNIFNTLPDKTTTGVVNQYFYDPQLDNGILNVWPVADDVTLKIIYTGLFPIEDFDAAGDNPDFPIEWAEALCYELALRLCPIFHVPMNERMDIKLIAKNAFDLVSKFDQEPESVFFGTDL